MIGGLINNNRVCSIDDYTTFYVTLDDTLDGKFDGPSNKTNLEEKNLDNSANSIRKINLRYYDTNLDNFSIYNKTNAEPKKINLDFEEILHINNIKKNKVNRVNNFKKLIDSEFNMNTPLISSKCSRDTKNLNKFITMLSGQNNKNILDKIVNNKIYEKI
jgi:hypothetical protein